MIKKLGVDKYFSFYHKQKVADLACLLFEMVIVICYEVQGWSDKSPFDYTRWTPGQPAYISYFSTEESCVQVCINTSILQNIHDLFLHKFRTDFLT